jgi:hypothetical protein
MPASRKTGRQPPPTAQLSRSLLQCRYDFQNKIWNLPTSQAGLNDRLNFSNSQAALLPLLNVVIAEFSDPSLGGAKPPKTATRRIGVRHSNHQSLGKPNNQQKRRNEN